MRRTLGMYLMLILLLVGCSTNDQRRTSDEQQQVSQQTPQQAANKQENEKLEVMAENLDVPWSIQKSGVTFYLSEKPGAILKIENGEVNRQRLDLKKQLWTASEAGLLGFVLAPDFKETNLAYAYYTYEDHSEHFNRIVTLRLQDQVWKEEGLLLDQIPSASWHDGGRLKIGPDGKLYATTGDASEPDIAQDNAVWGGKILRMNLDGSIPNDNPLPDSYVYSYGHRNPQGITWLPDGTLYASEHGNRANDEINKIEAGKNYGWPVMEGHEEGQGMVTPLFTSGAESTWAPSGMASHNGKLYVAALRGSAVLEFDLKSGQYHTLITGYGRIRDVLIEENYLYFISNNKDGRGSPQGNDDRLYRILLSGDNHEQAGE